jgi:predicted transcriptional regulator
MENIKSNEEIEYQKLLMMKNKILTNSYEAILDRWESLGLIEYNSTKFYYYL